MRTRLVDRWWVAALGALVLALVFPFLPRLFRGDADVFDLGALVLFSGLGAMLGAAGGILAASLVHADHREDGGAGQVLAALGAAVVVFGAALVIRLSAPVAAAGIGAFALGFALGVLTIRALILRRRSRGQA
jgi:hypothetical protein